MPSISKAQQMAAGIARAIQEGKASAKPGSPSAAMAKMPPKSLKHFASTSTKDLPMHARDEKSSEGRKGSHGGRKGSKRGK